MDQQKKNTGREDTKIIIVGNKCDLNDKIGVNDSDINYLKETNNLDYYETSEKMNINFFEPFYQISKSLIQMIRNIKINYRNNYISPNHLQIHLNQWKT